MRLLPFLIYALGVFAGAALLAFPAWSLAQAAGFGPVPFHKLCFRLLQACALIGLWPLMRFFGLKSASDWGFGGGRAPATRPRALARGFLGGILLLSLIVAVLLAAGARTFRPEFSWQAGVLLGAAVKAALAGLVIALVEETWFRGALQRAIETGFGAVAAIVVTALLYALVHFIRPDVEVPADAVDWLSGVTVIAGAFGRFADAGIVDSLAALFAVGILLALVRHHTGRIWECIGLHAGFVVVIRLARRTTVVQPDSPHAWLAGSFDGVIGWLGLSVFALAALVYWAARVRGSAHA